MFRQHLPITLTSCPTLVEFETAELIKRAVAKLKKMQEILPVRILIDKTEVDITEAGIESGRVLDSRTEIAKANRGLPDILAFLQRETELTRGTLVEILKQSGRLKDFIVNPQMFMTETAKLINKALHELIIDGIKYELIEGQFYEMRLFEEAEIEEYLSRLYAVQSKDDRTPYDYIAYDSEVWRSVYRLIILLPEEVLYGKKSEGDGVERGGLWYFGTVASCREDRETSRTESERDSPFFRGISST